VPIRRRLWTRWEFHGQTRVGGAEAHGIPTRPAPGPAPGPAAGPAAGRREDRDDLACRHSGAEPGGNAVGQGPLAGSSRTIGGAPSGRWCLGFASLVTNVTRTCFFSALRCFCMAVSSSHRRAFHACLPCTISLQWDGGTSSRLGSVVQIKLIDIRHVPHCEVSSATRI
jgi:hypothetical protein